MALPTPYGNQAQQMVQGAQAQGFFNPMGSPQINAAVRANALRSAENSRRRSALLSRLMGLDPNQARVAAVNADAQGSAATQSALNNAQFGQLMGNQQYARSLFGSQLQNEQQRGLLKYQHDLNKPTLGGYFGQALGYALPGIGGLFHRGGGQQQQGGLPSFDYLSGAAGLGGQPDYSYLLNQVNPYQQLYAGGQ